MTDAQVRDGGPVRSEEIGQSLDVPVGQGRAHRDGDELLSGRCQAEPGQALAGEGLELRAEGTAPLVDEVRLVDDEVLEMALARGGGEAAAEAEFHRLGGGDDDALGPVADRVADLLLLGTGSCRRCRRTGRWG